MDPLKWDLLQMKKLVEGPINLMSKNLELNGPTPWTEVKLESSNTRILMPLVQKLQSMEK